MESYITVSKGSSGEYIEKRSKFIANVYPCESEEEASALIAQARTKYWDAKHNVYAYVLKGGTFKFSDDGEPHATAGKPILDVITGSGLVDVMVIVTRYFGGVLLGTGGLVRAYTSSARQALQNSEKTEMCLCSEYSIKCDYSLHSKLDTLLSLYNASVTDTLFTENIEVFFGIKNADAEKFENALCEAFSSKIVAEKKNEKYFAFPLKNREDF